MNKKSEKSLFKGLGGLFGGRIKDLLLMGALAIVLFFTAWKIFREEDTSSISADLPLSDSEVKVMRILREIDGVGEASVVVCEEDGNVKSVVVVCEGANDLRVIMDVKEAVSAALDTQQKSVKIYLKKE